MKVTLSGEKEKNIWTVAVSKILLRALRIASVLQSGWLSALGNVPATSYPLHNNQAATLNLVCTDKKTYSFATQMSLREVPSHISLPVELEMLRGTGREQDVSTGAWTDKMAGALDQELKDEASGFTLLWTGWGRLTSRVLVI